jgi:hypothetical protein
MRPEAYRWARLEQIRHNIIFLEPIYQHEINIIEGDILFASNNSLSENVGFMHMQP